MHRSHRVQARQLELQVLRIFGSWYIPSRSPNHLKLARLIPFNPKHRRDHFHSETWATGTYCYIHLITFLPGCELKTAGPHGFSSLWVVKDCPRWSLDELWHPKRCFVCPKKTWIFTPMSWRFWGEFGDLETISLNEAAILKFFGAEFSTPKFLHSCIVALRLG